VEYTDYKQSHIYKFKYVKMIKYSEMLIALKKCVKVVHYIDLFE